MLKEVKMGYSYMTIVLVTVLIKQSLTDCPENCSTCETRNNCTRCVSTHRLFSGVCKPCPKQCTACDGYSCISCQPGWYGNRCESSCPINCESCHNYTMCTQCKTGYYGQRCKNKCSLCLEEQCDRFACKYGCKPGYFKDPMNCLNCRKYCKICETLNYCNACIDKYFLETYPIGDVHCQPCSSRKTACQTNCTIGNCKFCEVTENSIVCRGCQQGYKYTKGKCIAITVSTEKAQSSLETTCTTTKTTRAYTEESTNILEQDDSLNIVVIGSISGGGAAFLIVTTVLIAFFTKRRRKRHQADNDKRHEEGHGVAVEAGVTYQHDIPGNNDCLYAQVNKTSKRNNLSEEEPQAARSSTSEGVEIEEVMVNVFNFGGSDLEEIEEDNTRSSLDTDVNIPTSDTYYNTASLLRSRIEVSNLCEYTKNKTDYKKEFERLPVGLTRSCCEALKQNNRVKNRYNGIYAYDATRVVLKSGNYVNANFIDGHKHHPAYIASLGPTKGTMNNFASFWEMIWQENTDKIVMLTNLDEDKKMKCEQYWPEQGCGNNYGDFKVRCTAENIFSECIVRELTVAQGKDTREVTQYLYTAWPDKTVPSSVASLLELRDKVEQNQPKNTGPLMVHCSAGIGRTGTYIALDILIKEGKDDQSVDIFGCVNALRGQRVQMVQNVEQYMYLHHCVQYALCCYPEQMSISTMTRFTTDERMSTQYQAFVSLQQLANSDKIMGAKNKTRKENRMGADTPDDKHRVRLALIEKDYINAVYVNGYQERNKFILAQTPLKDTLEDFVSMLYQESCPCVVCLDDENGMDKSIVQYLPSVNKVATFGQFQVMCTNIDRKQDFISRKLKVSRIGVSLSEEVSVSHYQFKGWSSIDCVPRSIRSFLNIVTDVGKTYQSLKRNHPIVVHCSTGAERSGLFCAVSILLEKVAVEKEVSVLNTVCQVCSRRRSAFQDIEHLRFCYSCVEQMSEVSDTSTYYNSRNM